VRVNDCAFNIFWPTRRSLPNQTSANRSISMSQSSINRQHPILLLNQHLKQQTMVRFVEWRVKVASLHICFETTIGNIYTLPRSTTIDGQSSFYSAINSLVALTPSNTATTTLPADNVERGSGGGGGDPLLYVVVIVAAIVVLCIVAAGIML
jgi:hypothetical protein